MTYNTFNSFFQNIISLANFHSLIYRAFSSFYTDIFFFIPNDAQVIYIMEVSPEKHRAKLCSITKGIALLSVSLIGVLHLGHLCF